MVLASLPDASDLLRLLLNGGHAAKAGSLAGGLRHIGRGDLADEIVNTMGKAGYQLREINPFETKERVFALPVVTGSSGTSTHTQMATGGWLGF